MTTHTEDDRAPRLDQLDRYAEKHSDRTNLALHLVFVPIFVAGTVLVASGATLLSWPLATTGAAAMIVSIAVQGRGHARERVPFVARGVSHFVRAIFAEQLVTFPRFVLSGGFARTWRSNA